MFKVCVTSPFLLGILKQMNHYLHDNPIGLPKIQVNTVKQLEWPTEGS